MSIGYFDNQAAAPQILTGRDRSWREDLEISKAFCVVYGDPVDGAWRDGDPRTLLDGIPSEDVYLAVYQGRIGVMSEIELDVCPGDTDVTHRNGTRELPQPLFDRAVSHWSSKLSLLPEAFPLSLVFLSCHPGNYDGRLCVCAFTPLEVAGVVESKAMPHPSAVYRSPYEDRDALKVDGELSELASLDGTLQEVVHSQPAPAPRLTPLLLDHGLSI